MSFGVTPVPETQIMLVQAAMTTTIDMAEL